MGFSSNFKKYMNYEFQIIAATDDSDFSINLATECNRYGFSLSFINSFEDIEEELSDSIISLVILDLNDKSINSYDLCREIKEKYGLPIFAIIEKLNKSIQIETKDVGFDLIFTKKMLLNSIREVVIHVSKS